jgi:2-haloacid dehalogenase
MRSPVNRRKFVVGVSSLASAMMAGQVGALGEPKEAAGARPAPSPFLPGQAGSRQTLPKVLVFDVNQTLLDLNALRPEFVRVFGDGKALDDWFSLLLQYSLVVTVANAYAPFGTVGGAVLEMLARNRGIRLLPEDQTAILHGLVTLPAHAEVAESLKRLRAAGFHMVTLTNSSPPAVKSQLESSKLAEYFTDSISVDSVHRFKPDTEVYRYAAAHLGAKPDELLLVAAHAWDVFGAMKAGWRAAFVARQGITSFPLGPKPEIVGVDMKAVADAILK